MGGVGGLECGWPPWRFFCFFLEKKNGILCYIFAVLSTLWKTDTFIEHTVRLSVTFQNYA